MPAAHRLHRPRGRLPGRTCAAYRPTPACELPRLEAHAPHRRIQEHAARQLIQEYVVHRLIQEYALRRLIQEYAVHRLIQEYAVRRLIQAYAVPLPSDRQSHLATMRRGRVVAPIPQVPDGG
jgi:hypothetical protein